MTRLTLLLLVLLAVHPVDAQEVLVPMDEGQREHLKAYGWAYAMLEGGTHGDWLLNYRGGSFLFPADPSAEAELRLRGVTFEPVSAGEAARIRAEVESPGQNTAVVRLEKAPKIAVYAPKQNLPWDDAVTLVLTYAEVPYDTIYDDEVLDGKLADYDWLPLPHEDFSGQYGKFYAAYRHQPWYQEQQQAAEADAARRGFSKVSQLKLAVAQAIRQYVSEGGFLFAMCSGADTIDLALAAHATDIVPAEFDGDGVAPDALQRLDYSQTFAFEGFRPITNPMEYEHADIDVTPPPDLRSPALDYFTLFEFSAKWDPVPTMLTQDHVATVKGFLGQTTSFSKPMVKPGVVVLAQPPGRDEARYLYGPLGQGFFTFYGGHDPEDYQHYVGDPPTDLALHPQSPGYRLILNNILFPAAKKQKQKT